MERKSWLLPILVLTLASCGPKGFDAPIASTTTAPVTTYTPPEIVETKIQFESIENGKPVTRSASIVDGATTMKDWLVTTDGEKNSVLLKGSLLLRPKDGTPAIEIPVHLGGMFKISESTGYNIANLSPINHAALKGLRLEVSAKLMCLSEDCAEYFVNIYVRHNNQKNLFYRHQVHRAIETFAPPKTAEESADESAEPAGNTKDDDYYENDSVEGEPTYYVGETSTDLGDFETISKAQPVLEQNPAKKTGTAGSANSGAAPAPKVIDVIPSSAKKTGTSTQTSDSKGTKAEKPKSGSSLFKGFGKSSPKKQVEAPAKPAVTAPARTSSEPPARTSSEPPARPETVAIPAPRTEPPAQPPVAQNNPPRSEAETPNITLSKVLNQAIGYAYKGRLQRADNLLELPNEPEKYGFRIMRPEKKSHYATKDMLAMILHTGNHSLKSVGNYVLKIGDVSYKGGGQIGRHDSHQNGLDADISYYFNQPDLDSRFKNAVEDKEAFRTWMYDQQWKLFKLLGSTNNVDRIFIHPYMKYKLCELAKAKGEISGDEGTGVAYDILRRLRPEMSHDNHFHLRLQCSSVQKLCRMMEAPTGGAGCDDCKVKVTRGKYKGQTKKCSELGPEN